MNDGASAMLQAEKWLNPMRLRIDAAKPGSGVSGPVIIRIPAGRQDLIVRLMLGGAECC
jgi:hypothetical protein